MSDALIKPILTHTSEIWAVGLDRRVYDMSASLEHNLERVHVDILCWITGTRSSAPANHSWGKYGRQPSHPFLAQMMMKCQRRSLTS